MFLFFYGEIKKKYPRIITKYSSLIIPLLYFSSISTCTTLWENSADDKTDDIFMLLLFLETSFDTCKLSPIETICMLEMSNLFSGKNKTEKYFQISSAENFTQSAKR